MWSNFFEAGGFGMYPVSIFGFVLVAAGVLFAIRPERRMVPMVVTAGMLTLAAGLLGTTVGVVKSIHYAAELPLAERGAITTLGVGESLHDLVLALILVVIGGLFAFAGSVRTARKGKVVAES
jgi:hypothetical protein